MKKIVQALIVILFAGIVLAACGGNDETPHDQTAQGGGVQQNQTQNQTQDDDSAQDDDSGQNDSAAAAASDDNIYVLFVGNSFVFFGDMPSQLAAIAAANGINLIYTDISRGGFNLLDHEDYAIAEMERFQYDFVVFQDQSQRPLFATDDFWDDVYFLSHVARETGAVPVLYSPAWANEDGWPDAELQDVLSLIYAIGAYISDALFVNAGDAWVFAYYTEPTLDLYHEDMFHANYAGAFFTAAVFAATLFDLQIVNIPQNLPYTGPILSRLAELAWEFVNYYDFIDLSYDY